MTYGIFNDESQDWTEAEAVEADFYSEEDARAAIATRYSPDDGLVIHAVEFPDNEDGCETCGNEVCDCDEDEDN